MIKTGSLKIREPVLSYLIYLTRFTKIESWATVLKDTCAEIVPGALCQVQNESLSSTASFKERTSFATFFAS